MGFAPTELFCASLQVSDVQECKHICDLYLLRDLILRGNPVQVIQCPTSRTRRKCARKALVNMCVMARMFVIGATRLQTGSHLPSPTSHYAGRRQSHGWRKGALSLIFMKQTQFPVFVGLTFEFQVSSVNKYDPPMELVAARDHMTNLVYQMMQPQVLYDRLGRI